MVRPNHLSKVRFLSKPDLFYALNVDFIDFKYLILYLFNIQIFTIVQRHRGYTPNGPFGKCFNPSFKFQKSVNVSGKKAK